MTYETFSKILESYRKFDKNTLKYHSLGIDLGNGKYEIITQVETIFAESIESHYGKEGVEWVGWFIWESDWGNRDWSKYPSYKLDENGKYVAVEKPEGEEKYGAHDENGNPICYSIESLWEYLETLKVKEE